MHTFMSEIHDKNEQSKAPMISSPEGLHGFLSSRTHKKLTEQEIGEMVATSRFVDGEFRSMHMPHIYNKYTHREFKEFIEAVGGKIVIRSATNKTFHEDYLWVGSCQPQKDAVCSD